jgi:hypothetical protein
MRRLRIACVLVGLVAVCSAADAQQPGGTPRSGGERSAKSPERSAADPQRFLNNLQQSSRPSQQLGVFAWPDHKVTITDVGLRVEESSMVSCYWFGQVDSVQLAAAPAGAKKSAALFLWRRDNIRPIAIEAAGSDRGDFAAMQKALASAHRAWSVKYPDVTARLKTVGRAGTFGEVAKQARPGWYDEDARTVGCDEAITPRTAAQMPAGLDVGSTWTGAIDNGAAELHITSVSVATMTYADVKETLELQLGMDGEIVLRGVAYEFPSGKSRIFQLDIFRGRVSADRQSIAGTWSDAGIGKGLWSVSRKP